MLVACVARIDRDVHVIDFVTDSFSVDRAHLLHGSSRWKCGSAINRHEGIVLIRKSCQSEQSTNLDTEHTRTPQCRATARAIILSAELFMYRTSGVFV